MKNGTRIALACSAILIAFGGGVITGGTLVSHPYRDKNTTTVAESETQLDLPVPPAALKGQKILVIATPAAKRDSLSAVQKRITDASGVVTGLITLTPKFADPATEEELATLMTETLPEGVALPTDARQTGGRFTGVVLQSLMRAPSTPDGDLARSEFLDRMVTAGFFAQESYYSAATAVLVVTGGGPNGTAAPSETGRHATAIIDLARGIAERHTPTVMTGPGAVAPSQGPLDQAKNLQLADFSRAFAVDTQTGRSRVILVLYDLITSSAQD